MWTYLPQDICHLAKSFAGSVWLIYSTNLKLGWLEVFVFSHHLTGEESDSDSDEDLEGGVRHDLMMADEKVWFKMGIR